MWIARIRSPALVFKAFEQKGELGAVKGAFLCLFWGAKQTQDPELASK